MSLYNMMCGNNPFYQLLHAVLETKGKLPEIPRYRDTYTSCAPNGNVSIVIYTRTGGGNREDYEAENAAMAAHPLYICDYDDDFDGTFAHFVYDVPEEWRARIYDMHQFLSRVPKGQSPREKFDRSMASLKGESEPESNVPTDAECETFNELVMGMAKELGLFTEELVAARAQEKEEENV